MNRHDRLALVFSVRRFGLPRQAVVAQKDCPMLLVLRALFARVRIETFSWSAPVSSSDPRRRRTDHLLRPRPRPLATLPVAAGDRDARARRFMMYWLHRMFKRLLDTTPSIIRRKISTGFPAARFPPVNLLLGTIGVASCCCWPASRRTRWSGSRRSISSTRPSSRNLNRTSAG